MKKLIVVLFALMLSAPVLAMGEMGKGECIDSDNGPRVRETIVEDQTQEVSTDSSQGTATAEQ